MPTTTEHSSEQVFEYDGALWKPLPGCRTSFEEFVEAQERWMEVFYETQWNPWREEELQPDCDRAREVMGEWTRAEPDHRVMTEEEVQAWLVDMRRESAESLAADEARWARDQERYAPEREKPRWALLEREAMRARLTHDLEAYRSGAKSPGCSRACGTRLSPSSNPTVSRTSTR